MREKQKGYSSCTPTKWCFVHTHRRGRASEDGEGVYGSARDDESAQQRPRRAQQAQQRRVAHEPHGRCLFARRVRVLCRYVLVLHVVGDGVCGVLVHIRVILFFGAVPDMYLLAECEFFVSMYAYVCLWNDAELIDTFDRDVLVTNRAAGVRADANALHRGLVAATARQLTRRHVVLFGLERSVHAAHAQKQHSHPYCESFYLCNRKLEFISWSFLVCLFNVDFFLSFLCSLPALAATTNNFILSISLRTATKAFDGSRAICAH